MGGRPPDKIITRSTGHKATTTERGRTMKEQIIREIETIEDSKLLEWLYKFIRSMKKHRKAVQPIQEA